MRDKPNATRSTLYLAALALAFATVACATRSNTPAVAADRDPVLPKPLHLETAAWSPPYDGPLGYPKGAQRATVSLDARSGGETYYARFPAGSRFALHWHAHAEYAVVLRGTVTHILGPERHVLQPGDYVVVPPMVNHGWVVDPSGDVFLLIRRDGPADFNFVAPKP